MFRLTSSFCVWKKKKSDIPFNDFKQKPDLKAGKFWIARASTTPERIGKQRMVGLFICKKQLFLFAGVLERPIESLP